MFSNEIFEYSAEETTKIVELRRLVESCNELQIGTEDVLMSKFLNFTKWDVAKGFDCINRYYDFKHEHPDWVASRPLECYRDQFLLTKSKFVMTKPDKEGRTIFICKMVDAFDKYPNYQYDLIAMDDLIIESLLLLPSVQKNGLTIIYDFSGFTRNFIKMFSPHMSKMVNKKDKVLPITNHVVHIIQKGLLISMLSSLIVSFIGKDTKNKVYIHDGKNLDKLRYLIGVDSLPSEYGGAKENILDENIIFNHLTKHVNYLLKLQTYKRLCHDA